MFTNLFAASVSRRRFWTPLLGAAFVTARTTALPKPRRKIELLQTYVAGTAYYDAERAHTGLQVGDRLILRRQAENKYDTKAIEVFTASGLKLGYVPRLDNSVLTALMDDARELVAHVTAVRPEHYRDIGIAVALVE
jgi:hypothetical protein